MASFEKRSSLKAAAVIGAAAIRSGGVLLLSALAALAAPCTAFAQSASEPHAESERQQQLVAQIQQEQAKNGTYSPALIKPWTALAVLYEEDGSRALAIGAIEQARQVLRANYGLRSMKEVPLLRQEMHVDKAGGDAEAAWELEQHLLRLIGKHPDDPDGVAILREAADERLDWLARYRAGELPIQIILGCYYERPLYPRSDATFAAGTQVPVRRGSGSCDAGNRNNVIRSLFAEAKTYYSEAIGVLVRNRRYSSGELSELEAQLIRTSYSSGDYFTGEQSYRRLVTYNAANSAPWRARVGTFVEMEDWNLLFSQHQGTAVLDDILDAYEQAYALLERKGAAQASIDELFSAKIPVVLPSFLPNPLSTKPSSDSSGYIDVAFDIGKYGEAGHVRILGATPDATPADERDLARLIKRSLFRPIVTNGHVADGSPAVVRYYLKRSKRAALP